MPLGSAKATVVLWVHSFNECIVPYYSMYIYNVYVNRIYTYIYTYIYVYINIIIHIL
jgi:hypothetical protein